MKTSKNENLTKENQYTYLEEEKQAADSASSDLSPEHKRVIKHFSDKEHNYEAVQMQLKKLNEEYLALLDKNNAYDLALKVLDTLIENRPNLQKEAELIDSEENPHIASKKLKDMIGRILKEEPGLGVVLNGFLTYHEIEVLGRDLKKIKEAIEKLVSLRVSSCIKFSKKYDPTFASNKSYVFSKHQKSIYELKETLGRGNLGHSKVKKACNIFTEKFVAIKIFPGWENPVELKILKLLNRLLDSFLCISNKYCFVHNYIIKTYLPGKPLHTVNKMLRSAKNNLYNQIKKQLEFLHKKGFAHRDVRLENILYDEKNKKVYLIDFGHADALPSDTLKKSDLIEKDLKDLSNMMNAIKVKAVDCCCRII